MTTAMGLKTLRLNSRAHARARVLPPLLRCPHHRPQNCLSAHHFPTAHLPGPTAPPTAPPFTPSTSAEEATLRQRVAVLLPPPLLRVLWEALPMAPTTITMALAVLPLSAAEWEEWAVLKAVPITTIITQHRARPRRPQRPSRSTPFCPSAAPHLRSASSESPQRLGRAPAPDVTSTPTIPTIDSVVLRCRMQLRTLAALIWAAAN